MAGALLMIGLRLVPRSRVIDAVSEIADRVRDLLDLPGLQIVVVYLAERRTTARLSRPPLRRVVIDLREARKILYRLTGPRANPDSRMMVTALLARDLAPIRDQGDWDLLVPRISWVLGRLGAEAERAVEVADAVAQAEGLPD